MRVDIEPASNCDLQEFSMDKCGKKVTIHVNGKTGTGTIVDEVNDAFIFPQSLQDANMTRRIASVPPVSLTSST
jgi:hypothetical protein